MGEIYVLKAPRKPPKGEGGEEWRAIHRAADGTAPQVSATFMRASGLLQRGLDPKVIEQLIKSGALDQIDLALPWKQFQDLLAKGMDKGYVKAITAAADGASRETRRAIRRSLGIEPTLEFNADNPRLRRWIDRNTAELVREVAWDVRQGIKSAITQAQTYEVPPQVTYRQIRSIVGLTGRQAIAAQRVFFRGINEGLDFDEAQREAAFYAERLRAFRANVIARTETMRAANQGQIEGWEQAAEQGFFKRGEAQVIWVVTPDDRLCEICEPMDGEPRPLDGFWRVKTPDGVKAVQNPAEVHPQCRCAMKLEIP